MYAPRSQHYATRKEVILMNNLQRMSEMVQMQTTFIPQIEAIQALYRNVPPETLSLFQKMTASPTCKIMASLPVRQLENATLSAKTEKLATAIVDNFLSAFEKMTLEEQESIIDSASSVEIPKEIVEQAIGEPPHQEKKSFYLDIPCSVYVIPEDIDSSWIQIRKTLYPIVNKSLPATITLLHLYWNAAKDAKAADLQLLLLIVATVAFIVGISGDPNNPLGKGK